jgi:hypothetical protein
MIQTDGPMAAREAELDLLRNRLMERGIEVGRELAAFRALEIEARSRRPGISGARFRVLPWRTAVWKRR